MLHLLITIVVVVKGGVQEGLEKWIGYDATFCFACRYSGDAFFLSAIDTGSFTFSFYPDFSKLTWSSLNHALGHVFFTLSVGFGTMVTFGSYMRDEDHVPTAGFRVTLVDTTISLIAVVMIFPVAFQATNVPLTDPALMFEAFASRYLLGIRGGTLFGLCVLCLSVYGSFEVLSIGLLKRDVIVSNWSDVRKNMERGKATWYSGFICFNFGPYSRPCLVPYLRTCVFRTLFD